jgi:hypothetical protein
VKHRVQTAKTEHSNEGSIPSIEILAEHNSSPAVMANIESEVLIRASTLAGIGSTVEYSHFSPV